MCTTFLTKDRDEEDGAQCSSSQEKGKQGTATLDAAGSAKGDS